MKDNFKIIDSHLELAKINAIETINSRTENDDFFKNTNFIIDVNKKLLTEMDNPPIISENLNKQEIENLKDYAVKKCQIIFEEIQTLLK
ncbi:hypothetical protein [Flavobacterium sp.]|uniref:hypothetical protein n=1 Tax=Flavobacterium sp. TaxID=239 RepID=UPI0025F7CCC6|nr:hypothetical protein [Flavobacterium sp.]